jgi:small subunit ribosomal protein S24e
MEFQITSDKRNELLKRRELVYTLRFSGPTPSRTQIAGKLAATLNVNEKQLALDSLRTAYGRMEISGKVRVYDTEEGRVKTERAFLAARGVPKKKEEGVS